MSILFRKPPPVRLREASVVDTVAGSIDEDDYKYRRLGAASRDLLGYTLTRAQNLCVNLYRANPLANRIIGIYRSYLAGTGFDVGAHNPLVDGMIREFWSAPRSRLDKHHRGFARDWLIFGEGFHPYTADDAGNLTVGFIDPTMVERVIRDPRNNMLLTQVEVRRAGEADPERLKVVSYGEDYTTDDVGLWSGDISAWLFDRIAASSRGTPFLLPVLDWLDAYDQVLWEMLERQKALRAFFWDLEVQGGQKEVDEALAAWGTDAPRTGSVRARTDAYKVEAVSPNLGSQEDVVAARYQLRHIAAGAALAPHWVGEPEDANRSTAEQMDIPVLRSLVDTQAEWKANQTEMLEVAVDAKVAAGYIPRVVPLHDEKGLETREMVPARRTVYVNAPEIEDAKVEQAAAALAQVATAFVNLDLLGAVGRDVIAAVVRQMLPALGVPLEDLPSEDASGEVMADVVESYARRGDYEPLENPALEAVRQRIAR